MRRVLIILAILIVVIGAAAAAYFYFFEKKSGLIVAPIGSVTFPSADQGGTAPNGSGDTPTEPTTSAPTSVTPRLVQITKNVVVPGLAVTEKRPTNASSSLEVLVNYIERQSGNIFSYRIGGGITRTSNRTIPGIQSAAWLSGGTAAVVRYLSGSDFSTINTYVLPAQDSTIATTSNQGVFLEQNLADVAVSSSSILAIASGVNGSSASVFRANGTRAAAAFTTPLSALRAQFAGRNQYLAFSKPSASLDGSAFLVDTTGRFRRIAGPLPGLVAQPSPSGAWALVSYSRNGTLLMQLVQAATGEVISLPVATIADKCVWTPNEQAIYCGIPISPPASYSYPDDWYQGAVHFSDRIWKIDVVSRVAQLVLDFPAETNGSLDAEGLALNPSATALVFVNRNDGSLWSYTL
jgi:hypothetical protein